MKNLKFDQQAVSKTSAILISAILLTGIAFGFYAFDTFVPSAAATDSTDQSLLALVLFGCAKLSAGESAVYKAQIQNSTSEYAAPLRYDWIVTANDAMHVSINGRNLQLGKGESYSMTHTTDNVLEFCYIDAVDSFVAINVQCTDNNGLTSNSYTLHVADPAEYLPLYLNASATTADYIIRPDEANSFYYCVNGSTMETLTVYDTINATEIQESILGIATAGDEIYLKDIAFNYSALNVSENVLVKDFVNGAEREFINNEDGLGSPYTISIGAGADSDYYFCQDRAGRYIEDFISINSSEVAADVLALCPNGGEIVFTSGEFSDFAAVITGDFGEPELGEWNIHGQGATTILTGPPGGDVWTIKNNAKVALYDFKIVTTGSAVVGDDNGDTTSYAGFSFRDISTLDNLEITGGGEDKWLIDIENPNNIDFRDIAMDVIHGSGGMRFTQTSTLANSGDCTFSGILNIELFKNDAVAMLVTASPEAYAHGEQINMLRGNGGITVWSLPSTYSNTTGIWLQYASHNSIGGIHSESLTRPILLDYAEYNAVYGDNSYSFPAPNQVFVTCTANAIGNVIEGFSLDALSDIFAFTDANVNHAAPNLWKGWNIKAVSDANVNNTVAKGSVVKDMVLVAAGGTFSGFTQMPVGLVTYPNYGNYLIVPYGGYTGMANIVACNGTTFTCYGGAMTAYYDASKVISILVDGAEVPLIGVVTVPVGKTFTATVSEYPDWVWINSTP
ncbi:MAG: hypothetical protein NWF04_07330 [Candidatus Bathyarchaeota archaeon]|nr:hypothetical protein [Candidatus Bathyarchaeota archaeon]